MNSRPPALFFLPLWAKMDDCCCWRVRYYLCAGCETFQRLPACYVVRLGTRDTAFHQWELCSWQCYHHWLRGSPGGPLNRTGV